MKKTAIVMAVAMIGLALFGAAPAAADDEAPDQEVGPVEVQPVVNDSRSDTRVGFEDSRVDIAGQEVGGEFVVDIDTNPWRGDVSIEAGDGIDERVPPETFGGEVAGTSFGGGVGAEATAGTPADGGSTFVDARAETRAGAGPVGGGAGFGCFVTTSGPSCY